MAEMTNTYKNLDGKYEAKRQPGKPNTAEYCAQSLYVI